MSTPCEQSPVNNAVEPTAFWLIPLVVASALFMENMDASVIATSLPAIAADLNVDPVILKLAFTAYLVSLAIFIPVSGWCADRFGARRVFQAAIAVFVIASIGCASATNLAGLVGARALQGVGGAMMVPVGRVIVLRAVPKSRLVQALAWLTVPALVGPVMGPPLGGFITTYFHWRYIFWINVPVGLLGIVLAAAFMPAGIRRDPGPLDWRGFFLAGVGVASLVFGFTVAGRDFLPGHTATMLMIGGVGLIAAYVLHSLRATNPLIDLRLLAIPTFYASVAGGFLFRVGIGAIPFLLPLMLQLSFGLSPFASGSITFVAAAGALIMKFTAGPILRRFGFRVVLVANAVISAVFMVFNGMFTIATAHWIILTVLLTGGFFRSLQFTALNAIAYADLDDARCRAGNRAGHRHPAACGRGRGSAGGFHPRGDARLRGDHDAGAAGLRRCLFRSCRADPGVRVPAFAAQARRRGGSFRASGLARFQVASTKLSRTRFSPALSKATDSLLPSMAVMRP